MSLSRVFIGGLITFLATGAASATTWNVDQTGCSDTTCTPCCTIQGAVGHSIGNDVISVAPGTYIEQVDFRGMATVGDITLVAASGPGTVLVAPTSGHTLRHGDSYTNTVTIDGVDFTSAGTSACVYLDHQGDVVLLDVTANNCGYTAFVLDNPGSVTMERCTANNSDRTGIQIDGASSASLTDCTASSNTSSGIDVYTLGTTDIVNPTAVGNWDGIVVYAVAPTTITGATVTNNGRVGIWVGTSGAITIADSTVTGSNEQGLDIEEYNSDPVDSVTLTNTVVNNNGHGSGDSGVRLRDVNGPVVITNCDFNDNGLSGSGDGFSPEISVVGDLEIYGGEANGNADDGYDLRVTGNATVIGITASGNGDNGVVTDIPGTIFFQDCVANGNIEGSGFDLQWQDPDDLDAASVIDCTANNNGLAGGGNGIRVKHVAGPVTVVGTTTNGNSRTGVRVDATAGSVLIRDAVSSFGLEEGFKVDADVGPVTVLDCVADGNVDEGLVIFRENVDVESVNISRNVFSSNGGAGLAFLALSGSGPFKAKCNDIAGNSDGLYLADPVTVDARHIWWGDPTGPSGQGPGAGDAIFAESGGTITYIPWLVESFTAPVSGCPLFESDFESGLLEEWDVVVQ